MCSKFTLKRIGFLFSEHGVLNKHCVEWPWFGDKLARNISTSAF